MNGSTNMFWPINEQAVIYISICVVKRSAANVMAPMIDGANCLIVVVVKSVQPWSTLENAWATGKSIR